MAIQIANVKITGINPLLQNNPQSVDPFNHYSKLKKAITNKRSKTEDDLLELRDLETEAKIFFDATLGVYVPTNWLTAAVCSTAFAVAKIGKQKLRGGLFAAEQKAKLHYQGMEIVKTIEDVVKNERFRHSMILPQKGVRLCKDMPIFHNWHFTTQLEFDDTVVDLNSLTKIISHAAKYGGFGDFRPTFGRSTAEVSRD
jgi:hypothetical protein